MELALAEARTAAQNAEVPIGAVIMRDGIVIATAHNHVERKGDPTSHAEILAIQAATQKLGNKFLQECDLYVTLEPCTMCAGAIAMARIKRVIFAADDPKGGAVVHGAKFFAQPTCHHRPEVYGGVSESDAGLLLKDFFAARR